MVSWVPLVVHGRAPFPSYQEFPAWPSLLSADTSTYQSFDLVAFPFVVVSLHRNASWQRLSYSADWDRIGSFYLSRDSYFYSYFSRRCCSASSPSESAALSSSLSMPKSEMMFLDLFECCDLEALPSRDFMDLAISSSSPWVNAGARKLHIWYFLLNCVQIRRSSDGSLEGGTERANSRTHMIGPSTLSGASGWLP